MSRKINDENQYLVDNNWMDTLTKFLGKSDAQQRTEQELELKIANLQKRNVTREKNNMLEMWRQENELNASGVARLTGSASVVST